MGREKRDGHYRTKSLQELIFCYAEEAGRIDQKDREVAQKLIVFEVYARVRDTFDMLDADPSSAEQIYRQLIEH